MQELDDISLLREYVDHASQDAFATLVARHVDKVYSIALRHTRNSHQAEEIAHTVFIILARQAGKLSSRVILAGWLCRTAQLTAVTFIRSETRRVRREHEAFMQNSLAANDSHVWLQIEPLLDAAMAGLSVADHHALVLRYFDGKSMKEVGAALGATEDAAKMRVNRAVEKLRLFFFRRGIVVPVAVLTAAISASSVQAAPATLAKTATAAALANGAHASSATLTLVKAVSLIMAWTKIKTAIVVGVVLLLITGTATVIVNERSRPTAPAANLPGVQSPVTPRAAGLDRSIGAPGPGALASKSNPNARFADLTPAQRVQQARRHFPESVDDLRK